MTDLAGIGPAPYTVPVAVYGLRCTDPGHRSRYGVVYATSRTEAKMRSLAAGRCNEVVVSTDGGHTWARAEP